VRGRARSLGRDASARYDFGVTAPASTYDVCVIGGAGHVGAPLAVVMATKGLRTLVYDLDPAAMATLAKGTFPFLEEGGEPELAKALASGNLSFTTEISKLRGIPDLIVTIGTPIDEFHNPMLRVVRQCIDDLLPYLSDEQTIILRSTVFPGVTEYVHDYLRSQGRQTKVAFCPERVVQGEAIKELQSLPQIVSGTTPEAEEEAARLFSKIAQKIVRMVPKEAEFAKLFSNAYRYIQFAAANQFYMMVEAEGLDYARLLAGLKEDYPRMRDLPGPGLAAGPCLYKDTLQLAAFTNNQFGLGYSAIQVNEGLPSFLVDELRSRYPLGDMVVGLLGMAFKADSDDVRSSLSYKLKKTLGFRAKDVLTTDPLVRTDPELLPITEVIKRSDLLILCVPHTAYRGLDLGGKPVVDLWGLFRKGPVMPAFPGPVPLQPAQAAESRRRRPA
jgi:UDP-N-acetyl-D-mannosaminuronic acid dehydrogenase